MAAVLSALAMAVTVIVAVLLAAAQSGPDLFGLFRAVHIWGAILVAIAFVAGFAAGPTRMAALYGHLWNTEQPERPYLTFFLWLGIAAVIVVTYIATQ